MGKVIPEVKEGHFSRYPEEEAVLRPFLQNFDVTWAGRIRDYGSRLSVYFLKPTAHMERAFGFESEILAVYSRYDSIQPRTIQAIDRLLSREPARGRVDTMITFLISDSSDPVSWIRQYMTSNPESRMVAAFGSTELRDNSGDSWIVRSILSNQLYQRDVFDHRLPINNDYFFFGRDDLLYDFYNAAIRSENRGLFGLRKTGKTSVFFKLRRRLKTDARARFIYVDCKFPPVRSSRWKALLNRLSSEIMGLSQQEVLDPGTHPSDLFVRSLSDAGDQTKVVLVFDEVEYISPYSQLDQHWKEDFVPFWQTIWSAQSVSGNLAVFVGGVNPTVVEEDLIDGSQNPLFGIVTHQYLGPLTVDEIRRMLRTLGRPMGLRFDEGALQYIVKRYGGHPLLTRIACSITHKMLRDSGQPLPKTVDEHWLRHFEEQRDGELSFYCGHVVSELKTFYPDEFELLTRIATGGLADAYEFMTDASFTAHLKNYGLLSVGDRGRPTISIPVLERFVRLQDARARGRKTMMEVQPEKARGAWLDRRKRAINDNLEQLQREIRRLGLAPLFGPNSYPESHAFFQIEIVHDENHFASFINVCNRCFVEPVENHGKETGDQGYFWSIVHNTYPMLGEALRRIKVYRHNRVHVKLKNSVEEELNRFLKRDLADQAPSSLTELWFILQQRVLDELLVGILIETDQLT